MRAIQPRLTVFRLLLLVAVAAIFTYLATDGAKSQAKARYEHCLQIADWHGRIGAEYRKNALGDAGMLRTAAWHEHMRREFERAAAQGGKAIPTSGPTPPPHWKPPPAGGCGSLANHGPTPELSPQPSR